MPKNLGSIITTDIPKWLGIWKSLQVVMAFLLAAILQDYFHFPDYWNGSQTLTRRPWKTCLWENDFISTCIATKKPNPLTHSISFPKKPKFADWTRKGQVNFLKSTKIRIKFVFNKSPESLSRIKRRHFSILQIREKVVEGMPSPLDLAAFR